jgi:hypothetical protein
VGSPLIRDYEKELRIRVLAGFWEDFWVLFFGGGLQRRGARVNTLKIGSRDGQIVFGGI